MKNLEPFVGHLNISFGHPRTDTCATCDKQKAKESVIKEWLENSTGDGCIKSENDLNDLQNQMKLHKLKAEWF